MTEAGDRVDTTTVRPRPALSLPQVWALVALAGVFIILNLYLVRPHDFWWHVRVGQWIVENGRVPTVDLFSYTRAGEPYIYQMWLSEVLFYGVFRLGGLPLVLFLHAVIGTTAYALVLRVSQRAAAGDLRWAAAATLGAAALGMDNWNVRPQVFSILFFALVLYLIERHLQRDVGPSSEARQHRELWLLLPLFALWANLHGGYTFGLVLLGAYLFGDLLAWLRQKRPFPIQLVMITLLSGCATFLTPQGLGMVDYLTGLFRNPVVRGLTIEWLPPTIRSRNGLFFFAHLLVLVGLLYASRHRPPAQRTVSLLLFAALALMARRNIVWFGMAAAPTLAAALRAWASGRSPAAKTRRGRPVLNLAVACSVALLCLLSLPWLRPHLALPETRRGFVSSETPVEAVSFLRQLSEPRVFHAEAYGSYIMWSAPDVPVFIDTRMELYPETQWRDLMALDSARHDWESILDRYGADTLLLERGRQDALIDAVAASSTWQLSYQDEQSVILLSMREP